MENLKGTQKNIGTNNLASTNPVNNVSNPNGLTDAQIKAGYSTIPGPYDPITGKLKTQSTTTLSSDKTKDILSANNSLTTLSNKGVTTDPQTGVAKYSNGEVYNEPTTPKLKTADTQQEEQQIENTFAEMKKNTDAIAAGSIAQIQNQYARLKDEQRKVNESQLAGTKSSLLMSGAMQHDVYSDDAIAYRVNQGQKAIIDLENQENELINTAKAAQLAGNNRILEAKIEQINKIREEKIKETEDLNKTITEAFQKKQELNNKIITEDAISSLYEQGITDPAQISKQLRAAGYPATLKDVTDNVALISGIGGTGIVGEYNFYKSEAIKAGQVPLGFDEYQTRDANRKVSIAKAGAAQYGGYDTQQQKAIDQINTAVSNNPTYKKYVSMQTYANNVESALSQGSGIGDIAAINQFQKVIDEGAVTRDQDVKLIQGAQSLAQSLQTKIKKLQKGDQLSTAQRNEMLQLTKKMLDTQKTVIDKDPGVVAQKKKAERYKIDIDETSLGELRDSNSSNQDILKQGEQAKSTINSYYLTTTPDVRSKIDALYSKGIDDLTILEQLKTRGLLK